MSFLKTLLLGSVLVGAASATVMAEPLSVDKLIGEYDLNIPDVNGTMKITADDQNDGTVAVEIETSTAKGQTCSFEGYGEVHFSGIIIFYDPSAGNTDPGTYSYGGMAALPNEDASEITILNDIPNNCGLNASLQGLYTKK